MATDAQQSAPMKSRTGKEDSPDHSRYEEILMEPLQKAMVDICHIRPLDPLSFLSGWLRNYKAMQDKAEHEETTRIQEVERLERGRQAEQEQKEKEEAFIKAADEPDRMKEEGAAQDTPPAETVTSDAQTTANASTADQQDSQQPLATEDAVPEAEPTADGGQAAEDTAVPEAEPTADDGQAAEDTAVPEAEPTADDGQAAEDTAVPEAEPTADAGRAAEDSAETENIHVDASDAADTIPANPDDQDAAKGVDDVDNTRTENQDGAADAPVDAPADAPVDAPAEGGESGESVVPEEEEPAEPTVSADDDGAEAASQ